MTTSTDSSARGRSSIRPWCSSTLARPVASGAGAGAFEHRGSHVDTDDAAVGARHLRGDEQVGAGAAAEIEDDRSRFDASERPRVGDAREALDGRVGNVGELGSRVVEFFGPGAAGREDEVPFRLGGDLGVGLRDFVAQDADVDRSAGDAHRTAWRS
jgi:hypothetical protein